MLKRIIIALVVCAAIGGVYAYYEFNKPHAKLGEVKLSVSATDLTRDYVKNDSLADLKYGKNLTLLVTGRITEVKSDTSGVVLKLETGDAENTLSCVLDRFAEQTKKDYKVGEDVSMKGVCLGIVMNEVTVDRCVPK